MPQGKSGKLEEGITLPRTAFSAGIDIWGEWMPGIVQRWRRRLLFRGAKITDYPYTIRSISPGELRDAEFTLSLYGASAGQSG